MNTTYFLNCVRGNLFKTETNPALPSKYYIGLSATAPAEDGTGVTEPATNASYARVELTSLVNAENGCVTNSENIYFKESTADWGIMTHFVIYDTGAVGKGNLLMYGELSTPRNVEAETIMTVKAGYLNLAIQNPA